MRERGWLAGRRAWRECMPPAPFRLLACVVGIGTSNSKMNDINVQLAFSQLVSLHMRTVFHSARVRYILFPACHTCG
jgi:hypothetical protein